MSEPRNWVVQVRRFGGPNELEVVDAPMPTAGRGEVRVRVLASGIEYTDVVIRRHLYAQTMFRRPPFVMGYDVVGEIDQLGDGVRELQIGDRVADMNMRGRLPPGNQLSNRFQRNTRMLPVGSITRAAPLYRRTQAERLSI
jgi:NADPH:quinone reductase